MATSPTQRSVTFEVKGDPVPMPRMTRNKKWQMLDHPVWGWRDKVREEAVANIGRIPDGVPVRLSCQFTPRFNRGDLDNYIKAVKDAMQDNPKRGVYGVYSNDRCVKYYGEMRLFRANRHNTGCIITLSWPAGAAGGE